MLRKAIELSQHSVYWHCRLIFQLAVSSFAYLCTSKIHPTVILFQQIHATERDYQLASSLLSVGVDYAHISNASYTRVLFLLSRGMVINIIIT